MPTIASRYNYDPEKDLLGKGGFSKVFKSYDSLLDRQVALKIFLGDSNGKYNVIEEIRKVIRLDEHHNLCRYFDVTIVESRSAFDELLKYEVGIMEYLDGGDIRFFLQKQPQYFDKLLIDVLNGLQFLHKNGIVHRDLKPQNILVKNTMDGPVAKITDFGISKNLFDETAQSTVIMGTLNYVAPEQISPEKYGINGKIGTNLDYWYFGCLVFDLIKGRPPFFTKAGEYDTAELLNAIINKDIDLDTLELKEPYKTIIATCLVKNATQRNVDPAQLIKWLQDGKVAATISVPKDDIKPPPFSEETIVIPKTEPVKVQEVKEEIIMLGTFDQVLKPPPFVPEPEPAEPPPPTKKINWQLIIGISVLVIFAALLIYGLPPNDDYSDSTKISTADSAVIVPAPAPIDSMGGYYADSLAVVDTLKK